MKLSLKLALLGALLGVSSLASTVANAADKSPEMATCISDLTRKIGDTNDEIARAKKLQFSNQNAAANLQRLIDEYSKRSKTPRHDILKNCKDELKSVQRDFDTLGSDMDFHKCMNPVGTFYRSLFVEFNAGIENKSLSAEKIAVVKKAKEQVVEYEKEMHGNKFESSSQCRAMDKKLHDLQAKTAPFLK